MQGEKKERWEELCQQAANEQDPQKLLKLVQEINRLLAEKRDRLNKTNSTRDLQPRPEHAKMHAERAD